MIAFNAIDDHNPALAFSPLLRAVQLTIGYMEEHGPIGLTPAKALKRYFVHWAADAFQWPYYTHDDLFALNKVLNEIDFPPLVVLHDVLVGSGLARHYKGALRMTKLGHGIATQPGKLWALLAEYLLCGIDHADYSRFGDQLVGNWEVFLNILNVEAQGAVTKERFCTALFGEGKTEPNDDFRLRAALYIHVLRPLCWAGLLSEHRPEPRTGAETLFVKTSLWRAALTLETDGLLPAPTRH